ncbi:G-protein coupled receptors family 1 profile domain-containing protein [Caenorhabditis elegans]|uniref:G-protein coupled receptors family 1 profile domain-containing protein n=1 Tax=Caenorhabditis elegans TaxID=6239 RepID=Q19612_CAEEL|nr:G-protein coupled receptors family 1 profile domain-containing protein [Caenorhabditis elegans]CCD66539.1 G-protein coupled receptors family 1 profile domain-containing protein [Caenorhabditis elegans]|eukprot:NP_504784.2 Uncharacterized protein CELE_F20A1.2 [Caenorhabditis elegans]
MTDYEVTCGYTEEVSMARFIYISVGGIVACVGCICNIILLYLFTFRQLANSPPQLYPAILAFLDTLLCFFFLMIFVVDVNMIYNKSEYLFLLFHRYIIVTFCTAKLVQFLIPYMLMLGTLERYTWIDNKHNKMAILQPKYRPFTLGGLVLGAIMLRVPSALALKITDFPKCPDFFRTLAVDVEEWAQVSTLYTIHDVYGIACLQTFCPFLCLMVLNLVIVNKLAKIDAQQFPTKEMKGSPTRRKRSRVLSSLRITKLQITSTVRNAIYTMVAIVSTYLISNSLHILLTLLEVTKASVLVDENDPYKASLLYTLLGDAVSILYMISSAVRILIYTYCNPAIRHQLFSFFGVRKDRKDSDQSRIIIASPLLIEGILSDSV